MQKKIIYGLLAVIIIAAGGYRLASNKKTARERVYQYNPEKPVAVDGMVVLSDVVPVVHRWAGTFEPWRTSRVAASGQGKVAAVLVDVGARVTIGQPLVQLDTSLLFHQWQRANVQVRGFADDVRRNTILAEADAIQGVQLEKAQLALEAAMAERATLRTQLDQSTIRAPFDGIVTARMTEAGAFAAPGMPLVVVTELSTLKFTVTMDEHSLAWVDESMILPVTADAFPGEEWPARVVLVSQQADRANRFMVQLAVDNERQPQLRAGQFGKLTLSTGADVQRIAIPAVAIAGTTLQPEVYVVSNGKALRTPIILGERFDDRVVVSSGLHTGDTVVTGGMINLFQGAPVTLK